MQRINNFGSFWQAYCLRKIFVDGGNEVEFIDIIPGIEETRKPYRRSFSLAKIKRIPYYLFQYKKGKVFRHYQKEVLLLQDQRNYKEDYDLIIIGSDEVFNCQQESSWGLSLQLFGKMKNQNVISYAASFGNTTIDFLEKNKYKNDIAMSLTNLRAISVRDENTASIIKKLTNRNPVFHYDPVIVGDIPKSLPRTNKKNYILVYAYDYRISDPSIINSIKAIAREEKLTVISVGFYQEWANKNVLPTPLELFNWFSQARYVVTDTFHGVIFSVRLHKQFAVIIHNKNRTKLEDLLHRINMEDRECKNSFTLHELLHKEISFDSFEKNRIEWRKKTDVFLKEWTEPTNKSEQ